MYTIEFAYIERLRGILIRDEDGNVMHDFYRIRTEDHLYIFDSHDLIFDFYYYNKQLRKEKGNESYIKNNKDKVNTVKYNKSGTITVNHYGKDITYDNSKNFIFSKNRINKKSKSITQTVKFNKTGSVALNKLLGSILDFIKYDNEKINESDLGGSKNTQKIEFSIDDDKYDGVVNDLIMPAVESLAIFL